MSNILEPASQVIRLTREMLFGRNIGPGRDAGDVFDMPLDTLRKEAIRQMERTGYTPAL